MRALTVAVSMLALTLPGAAFAQRAPEIEVAETLNNPVVQERVAGSVSAALAALLDLRIGALERAIDPWSDARASDTLRDRADPFLEDDIERETRRATATMGAVADEVAIMMPELRGVAARIAGRIDAATARIEARD